MKIPLSNRLLACCGYVNPGDRVADVGCDHGYLGIYLLKNGIAGAVIASDVREMPLQSAVRNAEKFGVKERMSFYLSDGIRDVPRKFDCMVCAGMGADTMMSILDAAPWLKSERYRLILQCQSKRPELRRYLYRQGYAIRRASITSPRHCAAAAANCFRLSGRVCFPAFARPLRGCPVGTRKNTGTTKRFWRN